MAPKKSKTYDGPTRHNPPRNVSPPVPTPATPSQPLSTPTPDNKDSISSIFSAMENELQQVQNVRLPQLVSELKSEVLGSVMKTLSRLNSQPTAKTYASVASANVEKPVPARDLREIHIQRKNLTHEESKLQKEQITDIVNGRFTQLGITGKILNTRELPRDSRRRLCQHKTPSSTKRE